MASKTTQDIDFQVIFLIDLNPASWRPRYSAKDATSAVVLWALKVLSYFNDYGKRKLSTLRWGYQFFSSRTLSHHIERRDFKEFTTVVFEEFENEVSKKFNDCFSQNHTIDRGEACTKLPAGAKNISCAFANATHDFQWDGPDTSSPLSSRKTQRNIISRKTRNIVFLLSDCPCHGASIEEFTGESLSALMSLEGLKNILIPSVLHEELKKHEICLQWVSTGADVQCGKKATLRLLLGGILKEFGGFIIPLSSICYSSICQNISTPEKIRCSFHGSLLPFKSVMDSYWARRTQTLADMIDRPEDQLCTKPCYFGMRGLLCSSGAKLKVHCSVRLISIFQSATMQCRPPNVQYASTLADGVPKSTGLETTQFLPCPMLLSIQGVIRHKYICPSWLHPVKAYLCFASDCKITCTDAPLCPKECLSGWFQEMLLALAKNRKSLVIDVIDCETGLPVCGILQPLTSVCGVISVVTSEFLWKFEKCLGNGRRAMLDWRNTRREKSSLDFFTDLERKPLPEATLQLTSTEVFSSVIGSQNALQGSMQTRLFRPSLLEPWWLPPEVGEDNQLFLGELARSWTSLNNCKPEDDDVGSAATLMGHLKFLYKSKSSNPVVKRKQGNWKKTLTSRGVMKTSGIETIDSSQGNKNVGCQSKKNPVVKDARSDCLGERNNQATVITDDETVNLAHHAEDEASLTRVVQSMCSKVIFEGANICTEITNIMMAVTNFYTKDINKREKDCVAQFIIQNVLVPFVKLREKYEGFIAADMKEHQLKEYQLQVLLRTEIAILTKSDEKISLVQEVTDLLRAISFMKDLNFLAVFLREVLLTRYCRRLPNFLCSIYEGLMIRPPKEILTPSKCSAVNESPMRRSVSVISNQPRLSGECRVFTRHLSAKDVPTKRREIFVPLKSKQKENGKKKKAELPQFVSAKAVNMDTRGKKETAKLVRRNLFLGVERAEENNSTHRGESQKREVSDTARKRHTGREFGRRYTTGTMPMSAVQETPARKQVPHALWNKQDRARKRSRARTDAFVLEESPMKELPTGESFPSKDPQSSSEIMFQRSQSFYGCSASRGPLTGAKSSTQVEIVSPTTTEPREHSQTSCGTRRNSLTDVSPLLFPPQHKKKFSLHGLLNATKGHDGQRNEMLQEHPKVSSHTGQTVSTKSSPRIFRKRSFSCIGFSSVPFPEVQQEKCEYQCSETGPEVITKSNSPKVPFEKAVPEVDECIEVPQTMQIRFKSPAEDSSTDLPKTVLCSGGCPPPDGVQSPEHLNCSPCDMDINSEPISYLKTSPCSFRRDLNDKNSIATRQDLGECVVVVTPIKGPLTSPVHSNSHDTNSSLPVFGTTRDIGKVPSPNFVSLRFSPRFSPSSSPQIKDQRKTGTFCSSPSETKRLSPLNHILRQQKRKRHLASSPVASKCCKEDISVQISDVASEEWSKNKQQRKDITEPRSLNVAHPTSGDDNLGSFQDIEVWLPESQKEIAQFIADETNVVTSPPVKKRRIQKYVFSEKSSGDDSNTPMESCSLHRDTIFEGDDEVFHSPSSLRRRCRRKTMLSASSIKILQESPLL